MAQILFFACIKELGLVSAAVAFPVEEAIETSTEASARTIWKVANSNRDKAVGRSTVVLHCTYCIVVLKTATVARPRLKCR